MLRRAAWTAVLVLCVAIRVQTADSLTLMWDSNPPGDQVVGYLLYVGEVSRVYPEVYDVGNQSFFIYPNAVAGHKYFFAVAAYNAAGIGQLSSELSAAFPIPPSLVNPGDQITAVGHTVALQLAGTDPPGGPVSYTASGLPTGLTLAESTGLISGVGMTVGVYSVTVTATSGVLSATESFAWVIDGGSPTVAITSPTTAATYSTLDTTMTLEGTASDDLGVVGVAWANDRGQEGAATGTTTWSTSLLPLKAGTNVIAITARDVAGNTATATISVTSPGTPPPSVIITLPTSAPTYTTSSTTIGVSGAASDGIGVTEVTWVNNRGDSGLAFVDPGQSASWSEPSVRLMPGVNVITVTAWNASGNSSSAVLTVDRTNNPPTLVNPGDRSNAEGDVVSLQLSGSDPDADSLTYTFAGLPPGLTLNPSSGLISGTLPHTAAGAYSTTLAVSDGLSTTNAFLTWTVTGTPQPVMPLVIAANKPYDGTTSATLASCTLSGFARPGLVALYSFDEGPGTTVVDWSGYGNHGSVVDATWTAAGRYGGALRFDGISAHVAIPDAPSLNLTTGMTLESWVWPTSVPRDWRDVIYKGTDTYYLSASSPDGVPVGGGTFGSRIVETFGTAVLAANTWTHLATTYDGVRLRLYVNGVEVASVARTGSLITSDYPLEIAGDSIYGQHFAAIIDEVRVYNVALTPEQIQADLNLAGPDPIGCAGVATFDSPSVGEAKTVTVTDLALTGPAAAEFILATTTATTTATILPRTVTAAVTAANKLFDGTTNASLASCAVIGVVGTEAVECTGSANFNTADVGEGQTVTVTNLALTGADAGNYTLAATSATTTAGIQPRTLTPTVTVADKRYDGTTGATLSSCTVTGVNVGCTGTAMFDSADVGTGKTVTVTNLTLTGANAGNYALATTTMTTTATIYDMNQAPVVTNPGAQSSFQGISATLAITAMDPDGDSFTFSAANLPPGLAINASTGMLSGTPTTLGAFTVVISASDGRATGQASFSWNITSLLPTPATPLSPSGSISTATPVFSWTADGSAAYYALSVSDASASSPTISWYTPTGAACPLGGTCTVAAPQSLTSGLVTWAVITWNPFGYGPWSTTKSAVVDFADPAVPTPVPRGPSGPIATRMPTYRWDAISYATWYQLSITALGVVRDFWYSPSQACVSAPCAVTPNALLPIAPAQWRVRAWRVSGAGAWTDLIALEAADSVPGTATLVSPLSPVTTVTPSFTWNAVLGTSYYLLRVTDRDNVTVDRWYVPTAVGCPIGTGICTASPGVSLNAGAATWSVLTWNGSGYGPWSATREFLVEIADPAALTPTALSPTEAIVSSNAAYRWTAVAGAMLYRLSIRNNVGAPAYWWFTSAAAGCDAAECSVRPQVSLLNGTAQWQVQVWTSIGYGPWSPLAERTVNIPAPPAPTLLSPSGASGTPSPPFRWNASANATLYYISASDATGLSIDKWLAPSQVGCASGGVCTLNADVTLTNGAGSWQVIAWNPTGYSPWSSTLAFVVP